MRGSGRASFGFRRASASAADFPPGNPFDDSDTENVDSGEIDLQCWNRDPPNPGTADFTQALRFTVCR